MEQNTNTQTRKDAFKAGALMYGMSALLFAVQLMLYIKGSTVLSVMDFGGWMFFIASCLSHAACMALVPLLVYVPFALLRSARAGLTVMAVLSAIIAILLFLNMQVYDIYRFHINGFVLNMVFGSAAGEIFTFDTMLYVKEGALFALLMAVVAGLAVAAWRFHKTLRPWVYVTILTVALASTLFAHVYHIYASFHQKSSVQKSRVLLPYYFPTSATGLMLDLGFELPANDLSRLNAAEGAGADVCYPQHSIVADTANASKPNIVMILLDSWSKRALTPETMPITYKYAQENRWYANHYGCSNGTRSSIFGLFFSAPTIYWDSFESGKVSPVLIDELLRQGYDCQVYPAAPITDPPFFRVVFQNIPNLNISTEGNSTLECDTRATDNFIADMRKSKAEGKPFFSFIFYDLPHSFQLPKDSLNRFTPTWEYADYTSLNNDADPTPFFNLYRHTCYQDDRLVGRVLQALEDEGIADNTIVILSGDHAQEFNENKKNFWGHNGNFSQWQVAVPLIVSMPGDTAAHHFTHRTTHYDIVPTLMTEVLGVSNPINDYSIGRLLNDTTPRDWHVVGSELNYAFIIGGDTILEKTAQGTLDVYDAQMNPVVDYHLNPIRFNDAIQRMNMFYKK